MSLFAWNLVLAVVWAAIQGSFTLGVLAVGFAAGYLVLLAARPVLRPSGYYAGIWRAAALALFFAWELVAASVRVAAQVLAPRLRVEPGIVAVPLELRSDAGITLLANLVSLTPGTLTLDVAPDRSVLYVHVIHLAGDGGDAVRRKIKDRLERRILRLLG